MATLKIGGKDYDINPGWGLIEDVAKRAEKKGYQNVDYLLEAIWTYLPRRFIFFKPFLSKRSMRNSIMPKELQAADKVVADLTSLEGKEGGNSV